MEGIIAAAGSVAGGAAANAIMGKPAALTSDTSIPGIVNATVQKGTKSNPAINVAQVDPTQSINYFQQAAQSFQQQALTGLNLYDGYMQTAINSLNTSTTQAKDALTGMIVNGDTASAKYMQMLGLTPASQVQTSGFADTLTQAGYSKDLINLINQNETITDPTQRAAAQQQVADMINKQSSSLTPAQSASIQAAVKQLAGPAPVLAQSTQAKLTPFGYTNEAYVDEQNNNQANYNSQLAAYNQQVQSLTNQYTQAALTSQQQDAAGYIQQYNQMYGVNPQTGYTGQQIQDTIEQTPGYKFQLDQGNQAVARAGLASGMGASGNTLAAAQQFGQGLADNYYQQYLSNLQSVIQPGNQASSQLSGLYQSQGQALSSLYGNMGTTNLNTYQNIGQAYENSYTNAGQSFLQAALYNAQAQNQAMSQKRQNDANMAQQSVASGSGYMNAATNAAQFNYGVFQNQQGGQSFYSTPSSSGGSTSSNSGSSGYNPNMAWYF